MAASARGGATNVGHVFQVNQPQSQLARYVPQAATTPGQLKALGARAWIDTQTLVVRLAAVEDPIIRGMIVAVAESEYGRGGGA